MKHILFAGALEGEISVVKQLWEKQPSKYLEAVFLITGMGDTKTRHSLTTALNKKHYDFIINIGVCGYKTQMLPCIQIVRSVERKTEKELMVPVFFHHATLESILSSETPVYTLENEPYADMESYAIEDICETFRIPRIILKVPIDKVGEETKNFNKTKALETLKENIDMQKLTKQIEKYLMTLPKIYDIEGYSSHYHLTFSEKIIFERYFHKYTALLQKDFGEFFEAHKHLSKKIFLKTLSDIFDSYSLI